MDDFLGQAVPSPILDNEASAARSRGAPVNRYGPLAALTACLVGLACLGLLNIRRLGLPNIQRPAQTLPSAEINSPAQKTTKESQRPKGGSRGHTRRSKPEHRGS